MNTKLFVGNLSFEVTENDLQDAFVAFGPVSEVNLMTDRSTGRSRGFAFVTMATPEGAQAAIQGMGGKDLKGRALTVNEARPREERTAVAAVAGVAATVAIAAAAVAAGARVRVINSLSPGGAEVRGAGSAHFVFPHLRQTTPRSPRRTLEPPKNLLRSRAPSSRCCRARCFA